MEGERAKRGERTNRAERKEKPRDVQISTAMSMVLRHNAADLLASGVRADGFCKFDELLQVEALQDLNCTREDLETVVRTCPKKRFELAYDNEQEQQIIRATQGHSLSGVQDDKLLQPLSFPAQDGGIPLPESCVHGTYRHNLEGIQRFGLLAGGGWGQGTRKHVHFVAHEPGARDALSCKSGYASVDSLAPVSGLRHNIEIAIWIDLQRAVEDGVPFYASRNGVIVSPGINGVVPTKYIIKVKDIQSGEFLDVPAVPIPFDAVAFETWKREQLVVAVRRQVEFYFGDENYPQDTFLAGQADAEGWVDVETIVQFNKMKKLEMQDACEFVCACLADSTVVEVSVQPGRIRRRQT